MFVLHLFLITAPFWSLPWQAESTINQYSVVLSYHRSSHATESCVQSFHPVELSDRSAVQSPSSLYLWLPLRSSRCLVMVCRRLCQALKSLKSRERIGEVNMMAVRKTPPRTKRFPRVEIATWGKKMKPTYIQRHNMMY